MSEAAVNHRRDDLIRIGVWKILWVLVGLTAIPVRLKIDRKVKFPRRGPLLLVANHPNGLVDPVFLAGAVARPVRFLGKAPLFELPVLGALVRGARALPIHRPMPRALPRPTRRARNP